MIIKNHRQSTSRLLDVLKGEQVVVQTGNRPVGGKDVLAQAQAVLEEYLSLLILSAHKLVKEVLHLPGEQVKEDRVQRTAASFEVSANTA